MQPSKKFLHQIWLWLNFVKPSDFIIKKVTEHPNPIEMTFGEIYVVGQKDFQKWAYFLSPSGSNEVIQLSLQKNRHPYWSVSQDFFGRATIHPSIRQTAPPYEHYWLRKGKILWCADSGQAPTKYFRRGEY